jgi:hypothetical protein
MVMDDNPYQSPRSPGRAEPKPGTWHPFAWAVMGFGGGIVIGAPLILSVATPISLKVGGVLFGGIIGAISGLAYGIKRRW